MDMIETMLQGDKAGQSLLPIWVEFKVEIICGGDKR